MTFKKVKDIIYTMREVSVGYEVIKWKMGEPIPMSTYVIHKQGTTGHCNCPSRYKPCKHIDLMQRMLRAAQGVDGGLVNLVSDGPDIWEVSII